MSLGNLPLLRFLARLGLSAPLPNPLLLPDPVDDASIQVLLNRSQVRLDTTDLRAFYAGKRIMVTGAGGSIGSEIAKQALGLGAVHVSLVDHSELALYEVDRAIRLLYPNPSARPIICSIRQKDRLNRVIATEKPDVIFHAAALKHVPMVELNPSESVLTNIVGTQNVIEAAKLAGVERLVLISSDKAVAPASLMGATKRMAEYLISSQIAPTFQACTVRFGNVLGSTGSVVPLFKSQIERGGPITITDADAERFFMTIFEAVQLVLKAAMYNAHSAVDKSGLYILEMGKPLKILGLAERLIALYGLKPHKDVKITFTGLREGEKITEALLDDNEIRQEVINGIFEVLPQNFAHSLTQSQLDTLFDLAREGKDEATKAMVFDLVKDLRQA
jgi:O-antigen biosynthesis protein WbqV